MPFKPTLLFRAPVNTVGHPDSWRQVPLQTDLEKD